MTPGERLLEYMLSYIASALSVVVGESFLSFVAFRTAGSRFLVYPVSLANRFISLSRYFFSL